MRRRNRNPPPADHHLFEKTMGLCREGRLQEAEAGFRQMLKASPRDPRLHFHLGLTLARQDKMAAAAEAFANAAALDDRRSAVFNNLGSALYRLGRVEEAADAWRRAIALAPTDAGCHVNYANALYRLGALEKTAAVLQRAIDLGADHPRLRNNLGQTLQKLGRTEAAITVFRTALQTDPANATAAHLLAALTGANPESPPTAYVAEVFDSLAPDFDRHLSQDLGYRTPRLLRELFDRHRPTGPPEKRLIDLGCGTGLSGAAFQDIAAHLTGLDLSAPMLATALAKGIYDDLYQAEIVAFLDASAVRYDLFIAADTFCYTGNLAPMFTAVRRCMANGAFFVFSLESAAVDTWRLRPTGRYVHGAGYIQTLARQHDLTLLEMQNAPLRKERGEWIDGLLVLLTQRSA